ncbi:hypothetical protein FJR41_011985 [Dolichospermum planctonicum UHCC 0167]|jgi:hypothetical protein|nr:hypothetical protein [Dolichospermum planctonicum]MCW9681507.1 hypothetical protein [Dolichospermum planctonicum UHCC 0167]
MPTETITLQIPETIYQRLVNTATAMVRATIISLPMNKPVNPLL